MPRKIEQLEALYVGAVAMPVAGDEAGPVAETVFFGHRYGVARASIEHHEGAVASLVAMCDEIEKQRGYPWRLLKFDATGVHELNKDDYRSYDDYCQRATFSCPAGGGCESCS